MGKTPERANGGMAAPVLRYRRKVPTTAPVATAATEQQPVGADTKQQQQEKEQDNQTEHREAERMAGDGKSEPQQQTPKQKPLNPGGPARKKKPKAHAAAKDVVEKLEDAAVVTLSAPSAALPKKKAKKRQLPNNNSNGSDEPEAVEPSPQQEPVDQSVEVVKPKPAKQSGNRKHKNDVNNGKHKGPSLLKQLLWKAKPVVSPPPVSSESSVASSETLPPDNTSPPPSVANAPHKHKQSQAKRSGRPNAEDQEEEEEVAYNVSERHNRKLQASKSAVHSELGGSDSCCPAPVVCGELSSQETQFGSDEDEASTAFLAAFENLVPSGAIEPKNLSPALQLQQFYPTTFPLALTTDAELLAQHGIKVREVLIEDFNFHPPLLRVQPGDVVVWKVSGETLGMVEHSLEASLLVREPKQKKPTFVKATTPPLGSGGSFAWRFEAPARIHIQCSVYQSKGVVVVMSPKTKKEKKMVAPEKVEFVASTEEESPIVTETAPSISPQASLKAQKRKEKFAARKRAAAEARAAAAAAAVAEGDNERDQDSLDTEAVFHPPQNLARSAEMDAGVCRAVLTQLEEVVAAVHAATDVIVIGDVECPVLLGTSNQDEAENPEDPFAVTHVHSNDKASALADEWSGTEEDDDEDEDGAENRSESSAPEENEIEDFQQRIIGMLKRSEDARAQHRRSFQQEQSGFDAGAAYDFFKQRFLRVQEERQIVYAACPEPKSGSGVGVTEVVSLLSV